MSDCRILIGLLPQLECEPQCQIRWVACLLKVSFNMQGLLKKFPSNNKLGGVIDLYCKPNNKPK